MPCIQKRHCSPAELICPVEAVGEIAGHIVALRSTSMQKTKTISWELLNLQLQSMTAIL